MNCMFYSPRLPRSKLKKKVRGNKETTHFSHLGAFIESTAQDKVKVATITTLSQRLSPPFLQTAATQIALFAQSACIV